MAITVCDEIYETSDIFESGENAAYTETSADGTAASVKIGTTAMTVICIAAALVVAAIVSLVIVCNTKKKAATVEEGK